MSSLLNQLVEVAKFSPNMQSVTTFHATPSQLLLYFLLLMPLLLHAQFPPGAGQEGSTALHADSTIFINWAKTCQVERGPINISDPEAALASVGTDAAAVGRAGEGGIVSLGDGGQATLTFERPIVNGPGYDFAVFENGFQSGDGYFLELAFVEVSSDGIQFFRFPAISKTDTIEQITNFDVMDPTLVHNLAGKYQYLYGTPFDLEELAGTMDLDIDHISHIRVIDVVGSLLDDYAQRDTEGNKINDPWTTAYPSAGFDLDAVGVIHEDSGLNAVEEIAQMTISAFPNPVQQGFPLHLTSFENRNDIDVVIVDMLGNPVLEHHVNNANFAIPTDRLQPGIYSLVILMPSYQKSLKIIVR